jgi:hypothetical protein
MALPYNLWTVWEKTRAGETGGLRRRQLEE